MYTQQDFEQVDAQMKRRLVWYLIPILALFVLLIVSFIIRIQWLSVLLLILTGVLAIFLWDISLSPVAAYRRFLRDLLAGRKREYSGCFRGFESREVTREGVPCRAFMLNVGEADDEKDDRLLYWDAYRALPDWQEGARLWVSTFDKSVCEWRPEGQA